MNGSRWLRGSLIALGSLTMGYAVLGALADPDVRPVDQLVFLAGVLVTHDAVLLPAAIGVGVLIGRLLPGRVRGAVHAAAFVTVTLLVVAAPLLVGAGRRPDNPSVLPLPYGRGFAVTVLLVWTVALTAALARRGGAPPGGRPRSRERPVSRP